MGTNALPLVSLILLLTTQLQMLIHAIPRKWQACQQLYTDRPAQIICLLSR